MLFTDRTLHKLRFVNDAPDLLCTISSAIFVSVISLYFRYMIVKWNHGCLERLLSNWTKKIYISIQKQNDVQRWPSNAITGNTDYHSKPNSYLDIFAKNKPSLNCVRVLHHPEGVCFAITTSWLYIILSLFPKGLMTDALIQSHLHLHCKVYIWSVYHAFPGNGPYYLEVACSMLECYILLVTVT